MSRRCSGMPRSAGVCNHVVRWEAWYHRLSLERRSWVARARKSTSRELRDRMAVVRETRGKGGGDREVHTPGLHAVVAQACWSRTGRRRAASEPRAAPSCRLCKDAGAVSGGLSGHGCVCETEATLLLLPLARADKFEFSSRWIQYFDVRMRLNLAEVSGPAGGWVRPHDRRSAPLQRCAGAIVAPHRVTDHVRTVARSAGH